MLVLILTGVIGFILNQGNGGLIDDGSGSGTGNGGAVGEPASFVSIEINPSVELTLDENGLVITAYGANEDGAVLLYGEEDNLLGKAYEDAVSHLTALAAELGYINEGHIIEVDVCAETEAIASEIKGKLQSSITAAADKVGIAVSVAKDAANSLLRELNSLKERYSESDAVKNLTPEKYKLVKSAIESGELTVKEAAELSNKELIERVNSAHEKIEGYATELYRAAKAEAKKLYELAMGIALDGVYSTVYLERLGKILTNPEYRDTFYYGAVYQAYKTIARTLGSLEDIIEFGAKMTEYELDEATVNSLAEELGITDTSAFRGSDGKITVGSVVRFVDEYLEKTELSEEVEERIEEILEACEDKAEIAASSKDSFKADLNALKLQIETIVGTVNTTASPLLPFLSADGKAKLEDALASLNATVLKIGEMLEGGLTEDELEELTEDAEEKAEAMLKLIKEDLTEEELERVKTLTEDAKETVDRLTKEFTDRLKNAEDSAKAEIERLREERKNKNK